MRESDILRAIRLDLGHEVDLVLWRLSNAAGKSEDGRRFVRGGLVLGASDLIGILGPAGRWFVLEVKSPRGTTTPEQDLFIDLVRSLGGFGAMVRSVEEARAALGRARLGKNS